VRSGPMWCLVIPVAMSMFTVGWVEQFLNGTSAQYRLCSAILLKFLQKLNSYNKFKNDKSNEIDVYGPVVIVDARKVVLSCRELLIV